MRVIMTYYYFYFSFEHILFLLVYAIVDGRCARAYAWSNCPVFWFIYLLLKFISITSSNSVATSAVNDYSHIFFFNSCSLFINVTQRANSKSIFLLKTKKQEDLSIAQESSTVHWLSHSSAQLVVLDFLRL